MTLPLIDVHAHLQDDAFNPDRPATLERCRQAGLAAVINAGTDLPNSRAALAIARAEPLCWALAGVHPHEAKSWTETSLPELEPLLDDPKVLGVGEMGLDYHYDFSPREIQKTAFLAQWDLAARRQVPIVVHLREAFDDFWNFIAKRPAPPRVLLHCFSGDLEQARRGLDLGYHFSIGGPLTFPKSDDTRRVFAFLPENAIHLETDCPYLTPVPFRGKRNEPARLEHSFLKLCEIRRTEPAAMAARLATNAREFFGSRLSLAPSS